MKHIYNWVNNLMAVYTLHGGGKGGGRPSGMGLPQGIMPANHSMLGVPVRPGAFGKPSFTMGQQPVNPTQHPTVAPQMPDPAVIAQQQAARRQMLGDSRMQHQQVMQQVNALRDRTGDDSFIGSRMGMM